MRELPMMVRISRGATDSLQLRDECERALDELARLRVVAQAAKAWRVDREGLFDRHDPEDRALMAAVDQLAGPLMTPDDQSVS